MQEALLEQLAGRDVGDCLLGQLLSYGRLGAIYRAHQRTLNRSVLLTLLVLPAGIPTQARQQFSARFLREAPRLSEVRHPRLLPLEAYGAWQDCFYLVTPAQPTRSLATMLSQHGCCEPGRALSILEQITAGLEHAHCQGLVHGALSPSQLLLSAGQQIQLAGLGWQQLLERRELLPVAVPGEHALTLAGTWLSAERYLAPECLEHGQAADIRSDVYALGVILGELLTAGSASSATSPVEPVVGEGLHLLPLRQRPGVDLPRSLQRVLQQACAAEPDRRFQRVSDLLAAFAEGLEQQRAAVANSCWSCPLLPSVGSTQPEAGHRMQEDAFAGCPPFPWDFSYAATPAEAPARFVRAQPEQQDGKRFLRLRRMPARRGRARPQQPPGVSRRRVLGLLVKGGAVGVLGASVVGGYLLTTVLMKPVVSQRSSRSHPQQAPNTAQIFTNPRDGRQGLLVRLPSGTFVAYERACTHVGVHVNYNSQTHMLVCPAHGAIFDPAHGGRVIQGPASRPLPQVPIHVGSDGTILIGKG